MADNKNCNVDLHHIKEAICIDTNRVYDSCADKDCLADLRVYLTDRGQNILDNATSVRCRGAKILNCVVDVDKVPFNKGFYSVDITFFVKVTFDAFTCPTSPPSMFDGLVTFSKKCILYGSEGNVKIFSSTYNCDSTENDNYGANTNPKAKVQTVEPICLDAQICRVCDCCNTMGSNMNDIPQRICRCFEGSFDSCKSEKALKVTLGVFTIVQLERDVQMLIPAYDFCVPTKECCCDAEDPCDAFKHICFPVDEFFPPNRENLDTGSSNTLNFNGGCGCGK